VISDLLPYAEFPCCVFLAVASRQLRPYTPYLGFSSVDGLVFPRPCVRETYEAIPEKSSKSLAPMPGQLPGGYVKESNSNRTFAFECSSRRGESGEAGVLNIRRRAVEAPQRRNAPNAKVLSNTLSFLR